MFAETPGEQLVDYSDGSRLSDLVVLHPESFDRFEAAGSFEMDLCTGPRRKRARRNKSIPTF